MQSPLPFQAIPAAKDAKYFFNDKGPRTEATTRHPQCFLFWNECDTLHGICALHSLIARYQNGSFRKSEVHYLRFRNDVDNRGMYLSLNRVRSARALDRAVEGTIIASAASQHRGETSERLSRLEGCDGIWPPYRVRTLSQPHARRHSRTLRRSPANWAS